jgi:hypothetical protein
VNSDTLALISRPYLQVVDDLLTAVVGGVVNEPIIFDIKSDAYPLAEQARDVRGVTGTADRRPYAFQPLADFVFSEGDQLLVWQDGGRRPDDGTTFRVDYFRRVSSSPLTDINVGSVTRTVSEAIGREVATLYEEINRAYLSAFIDTAEGTSLDLVVSILGVTRKRKDFATGLVTFFRAAGIDGSITISQGVALSTAKGEATFQTSQPRTMQRGQARIDVPVRAAESSKGEAGMVAAGTIVAMASPIAGIERLTNFDPMTVAAEDETDVELRDRARAALRGLGRATVAALLLAAREAHAIPIEVWDPNSLVTRSEPGEVSLLVEVEPERFASADAAIHETRAAGVSATLVARYVFFKPRLVGAIASGITAAGKEKVVAEVIAAMQAYVDGLTAGKPAEGKELLAAAASVDDVHDLRFVDVLAWRSVLDDPSGAKLADALVAGLALVPAGDPVALRNAIDRVLATSAPAAPGGVRMPDRDRVQGAASARATDAEIEAATFTVVPVDPTWFVVLDMESADVALTEG